MPKWPAIPNYSNSKVFKLLNVRIWKWLTSSNEFSISNSQLLHCAHCSLAQWVSNVSIFFQFIIKSFQYFINIQLYQSHYISLKLIQQISTRNQWTSFYKTSCKKHFKFVPNLSKKYERNGQLMHYCNIHYYHIHYPTHCCFHTFEMKKYHHSTWPTKNCLQKIWLVKLHIFKTPLESPT